MYYLPYQTVNSLRTDTVPWMRGKKTIPWEWRGWKGGENWHKCLEQVTNEKTKAQRCYIPWQCPTARKWQSQDSNLHLSDPKLFIFPGRVPGSIIWGIFTQASSFSQCPYEEYSTISSFSNEKSEAWKSEDLPKSTQIEESKPEPCLLTPNCPSTYPDWQTAWVRDGCLPWIGDWRM